MRVQCFQVPASVRRHPASCVSRTNNPLCMTSICARTNMFHPMNALLGRAELPLKQDTSHAFISMNAIYGLVHEDVQEYV